MRISEIKILISELEIGSGGEYPEWMFWENFNTIRRVLSELADKIETLEEKKGE